MKRSGTYGRYTAGCVIAWAILWAVVATQSSKSTRENVLLFFLGWLVGWTSATIARWVYPPPRRWSS